MLSASAMMQTLKFWADIANYLYCRYAEAFADPIRIDVVEVQTTILNFEMKYGKHWPRFSKGKQRRSTKALKATSKTYRRMGSVCFNSRNDGLQVVDHL